MKKLFFKFLPFLIILLFSLYASQKLFSPKFYTSHDGEGHVIRLIEFDNALREGEFPIRFAKRINHGLGYPYFNFDYPFIYYAGTLLYYAGFSYINSFKVLLIISTFLGGLGTYLFSKRYFGVIAALISASFYIFAPYRFLVVYVRGSVAEAFALGLLPFLFLSVDLLVEGKKKSFWFFLIILSVLITAHNITVFFAAPFLLLYFVLKIFRLKEKSIVIKKFIFVFILSFLLTSFFWFPALYEAPNTKLVELTEDYRLFFPSIQEVIYSPWGFGPYLQGDIPGKMSPQIGLVNVGVSVIAIIILLIRLVRRKVNGKDYLFMGFILVALLCFFLLFPMSLPLWDNIFYLKLVQHPWRLVGYVTISASVAAAYLVSCIRGKTLVISVSTVLFILLLYSTRNMVRVNMYIDFYNPFIKSQVYGPSTTSKDEHMPRFAQRTYNDPNPDGDLIASTSGRAKRIIWNASYHKFDINIGENAFFRDNTSYFPGWEGYIDGKKVPLLYKQDEFYRLRVSVPAGKHTVEFKYKEVWYRLIADLLSLFTFCGIVLYIIWTSLQKKPSSKKSPKKSLTVKNVR